MLLNQFIWNNYKESKEGQEVIKLFEEGSYEEIIKCFIEEKNKSHKFLVDLTITFESNDIPEDTAPDKILELIIDKGIIGFDEEKNEEFVIYQPNDFDYIISDIEALSLFLFAAKPDFFLPYFFALNFSKLQKIADTFNIELPPVPLRKEKKERVLYYEKFCKIFNQIKEDNHLTPYEVCAFLYDFAPKFIGKEPEILPDATNIWLCGGAKDDYPFLIKAKEDTTFFWQGNEDTKKGDIIVMYCLSPKSNIEFICRAINDGIRDPFFHYYGSITVGQIQKVEPIHISEIKSDNHLQTLPIVKKNLQGVNGTHLNNVDYLRILEILKEKGQDISKLPKLSSVEFQPNSECKNEREVETLIVEPFLNKVGYSEKDWTRQLPVRMGRGERNYPDYTFFAETKKGYEKAKMLLETKFWIKNNRELEETFQQAHSYALRLESNVLIICDKDFVWIYERSNQSFDRTKYFKFNWQELNNPDTFNKIKKIIGKDFL